MREIKISFPFQSEQTNNKSISIFMFFFSLLFASYFLKRFYARKHFKTNKFICELSQLNFESGARSKILKVLKVFLIDKN